MTEVKKPLKALAKSINQALAHKGYKVPHSVMLHALAAAKGESDWHVLCAHDQAVEVGSMPEASVSPVADGYPLNLIGQAPLTRWQLHQMSAQGSIDVVISVGLGDLVECDIDALNSLVSEKITGSDAPLMDIGYDTIDGYAVGDGNVALRVTAGEVEFECLDEPNDDEYRPCTYVSVWDGEEIRTSAKVSLFDGRVDDIATAEVVPDGVCEREFIEIGDTEFDVEFYDDFGTYGVDYADLDKLRECFEAPSKPLPVRSLVSVEFPVSANAHTDDYAFEIEFDAQRWLKSADEAAILALAEDEFGGNYGADRVAEEMARYNGELKAIFEYLAVLPESKSCGFEVYVERKEAMAWLRAKRPAVWAKALCLLHGVRLIEATEPEIAGRWDWLDDQGNACDMSLETEEDAAFNAVDVLCLAALEDETNE